MNETKERTLLLPSATGDFNVSSSLETVGITTGQDHILFLDGMRGLAALYVCLTHVWLFSGHPLTFAERILRVCMEGGHFAVNVFIVLSGYCLMLPFVAGKAVDAKTFFVRRAIRILPCYYVSVAISLLLGVTLIRSSTDSFWQAAVPPTRFSVLAHLLLLHDWFASTAANINYALWSVGVEWKIYFLFPVLVLLGRRFGFVKMAVVANIVGFGAWAILFRHDWLNPEAFGSSVYYVGLFAAGMATAVWVARARAQQATLSLKPLLALLVVFSVLAFAIEFKKMLPLQIGSFFGGALTCLWIVWLSTRAASFSRSLLSKNAVVGLGRISYSLYLIHPPVLQLVWVFLIHRYFLSTSMAIPAAYTLSVVASLIAAFIFYKLVEAPSIQWTRSVSASRAIQPVIAG